MYKQKQRYYNRLEKNETTKKIGPFHDATAHNKNGGLYRIAGQQYNKWRLAVVKAIKFGISHNNSSDIKMRHKITQEIRLNFFGGCNCAFTDCPEYNAIFRKVTTSLIECQNMPDKLKKMSTKEKKKFLLNTCCSRNVKRGNRILDKILTLEDEVMTEIKEYTDKGCRIRRAIFFRTLMNLDDQRLLFNPDQPHMPQSKRWFFYGFKKRKKLLMTRKSGASQKLPKLCKEKLQHINRRVNEKMYLHQRKKDGVPQGEHFNVKEEKWVNTDHLPVYREPVDDYTWGIRNSGRRQIGTGGKEKERFTVQLSIRFKRTNNKLKPFIIFKGKPNANPNRKNTLLYEFNNHNEVCDQNGYYHPSENDVSLAVSETANSNHELTVKILKDVIFPAIGVVDEKGKPNGQSGGVLVDDFKGHSKDTVKKYTAAFLKVYFEIMAGGITPVAQPLDKLINKIFKAFYREFYDMYILTAPLTVHGFPVPPSRQQISTWVVDAWKQVPEDLVYKSFIICGYKDPNAPVIDEKCTAIIEAKSNTGRQ